MAKAIYLHIPFCTNKCFYCDFNSYAVKGQPVDNYLAALEKEISWQLAENPLSEVQTIFIGGGTPTVLTEKQLEKLLTIVDHYFIPFTDKKKLEFTVEANPGTVNKEKLAVLLNGGVNRLSFGAQAMQNHLLQKLGRIHNADDIVEAITLAKEAGFSNISIDLMFGLPSQTKQDLIYSLERFLAWDLPHISVYSLKIEENTPFYSWYNAGKLILPREDEEVEMFLTTIEMLESYGYEHYEISNFAKKGFVSRHNITYWQNEAYYGFGAGAHGFLNKIRYVNERKVEGYINRITEGNLPVIEERKITLQEEMEDTMMLYLRLLSGIPHQYFLKRFQKELTELFGKEIKELIIKGLITNDEVGVRLTKKGILLGNEVFGEFINVLTD